MSRIVIFLRIAISSAGVLMAALVFAALVLTLGPVVMLLSWLKQTYGRPESRWVPQLPWALAGFLRWFSMVWMLPRLRMHSPRPRGFTDTQYVLLLVNHPTTIETAMAYWVLTRFFTRRFAAVMTHGHRHTPFGAVFALDGGGIFIRRIKDDNGNGGRVMLREALPHHFVPGTTLVLHPDGGRPTPESLANDEQRYGWTGTLTRMAKAGGLAEVLAYIDQQGIEDRVAVYRVTMGYGVPSEGIAHWPAVWGRLYHLLVTELPIEEIPRDPVALAEWMRRYSVANEETLQSLGLRQYQDSN